MILVGFSNHVDSMKNIVRKTFQEGNQALPNAGSQWGIDEYRGEVGWILKGYSFCFDTGSALLIPAQRYLSGSFLKTASRRFHCQSKQCGFTLRKGFSNVKLKFAWCNLRPLFFVLFTTDKKNSLFPFTSAPIFYVFESTTLSKVIFFMLLVMPECVVKLLLTLGTEIYLHYKNLGFTMHLDLI